MSNTPPSNPAPGSIPSPSVGEDWNALAQQLTLEWKRFWMDQGDDYAARAFRVDANMRYNLADSIAKQFAQVHAAATAKAREEALQECIEACDFEVDALIAGHRIRALRNSPGEGE